MVGLLFLPQNFGQVVGTYEGLLRLCECTLGGGSIFRWWGHLTTICTNRTFSCRRWWGPIKPSIILLFAVSPPFRPLFCSLFCPLFRPLFRSLFRPLFCPLFHPLFYPLFCPLFHPLCCFLTSCPSWWWGPYIVAFWWGPYIVAFWWGHYNVDGGEIRAKTGVLVVGTLNCNI